MNTDPIDLISAYCDRWCECCAFSPRCSLYAVQIASEMCGDLEAALELALGDPHPASNEPPERPLWIDELANVEPSPEERAEFHRQEELRRARIEAGALSKLARAYTLLSLRWLQHGFESLREAADPLVKEALAIVAHDSVFVGAKLHRALGGRDRHRGDGDHDPVQNDWNGSAKVALLSLERSETAWRAIVQATADPVAAMLADAVRDLRRLVQDEFPRAMSFVRPGFDEPWR